MTTSLKSKRRPVNFEVFTTSYVMGRPSSPPTHPPPPPVTQSVCVIFCFFFFLCKLNLKKRHTHTQTHFITHTLLFCLLRPDSGCQRWNDKSNYFSLGGGRGAVGSFPWVTHTHTPSPLLQLPSLITHYHHHHHHHPLLTSSDFPFSSSSSSTLWQGWVSILLFWARGRVNINPPPPPPKCKHFDC